MQHCWSVGLLTPDKAAQEISAVSVDLSTSVWMLGGRIDCWSSSVDAADAKRLKVPASEHFEFPDHHFSPAKKLEPAGRHRDPH